MEKFDHFVYTYRFYIGGVLILLILGGAGVLVYDFYLKNVNRENIQVTELKKQNEDLRNQLSEISRQNTSVLGVATSEVQNQTQKININTASVEELDKLPGIGAVRAKDIVSYREQNGGFKTIEDIKNIKGIGDISFEKLKDLITTGE